MHLEPTPTNAKPENDVSNLHILLAEGTGPMAYLIVAMLAEINVDLVQNEGYWNSHQADQCVGVRLPWYHRTSHFQWPIARLLRMLRGLKILKKIGDCGEPKWTRTTDPDIRNVVLYPTELWVHWDQINLSTKNGQLVTFWRYYYSVWPLEIMVVISHENVSQIVNMKISIIYLN